MKRPFARSRGMARGFTLLETLVAVSILGLIGTLSFGTFSRVTDSRERAEVITTHYHQVRQALLRMARELPSAFLSRHRDCDEPASKTIFLGKNASHGMRLDFTSFSHFKIRADANESDQNEISYFVDDHPDDASRKALFRRTQAPIDEDPDEGGVSQVLAEDVLEVNFEFYDREEKEWEDEWDSESSDKRGQLPMFVSVAIKVKGLSGEEETFATKTRLFLAKPIFIKGRACLD